MVTPDPGGYNSDTTPYGPEGSRALGGEALLHVPCGDRGGDTHIPNLKRSGPGGGGLSLAVSVIPFRDR